jgi:hypothetical protein
VTADASTGFGVGARGPGFWMNETSGTLRPVVERYLRGETLTPTHIAIMRAYLRQWMAGDFRGPEVARLRERVNDIRDMPSLTSWLEDALDAGIDPL